MKVIALTSVAIRQLWGIRRGALGALLPAVVSLAQIITASRTLSSESFATFFSVQAIIGGISVIVGYPFQLAGLDYSASFPRLIKNLAPILVPLLTLSAIGLIYRLNRDNPVHPLPSIIIFGAVLCVPAICFGNGAAIACKSPLIFGLRQALPSFGSLIFIALSDIYMAVGAWAAVVIIISMIDLRSSLRPTDIQSPRSSNEERKFFVTTASSGVTSWLIGGADRLLLDSVSDGSVVQFYVQATSIPTRLAGVLSSSIAVKHTASLYSSSKSDTYLIYKKWSKLLAAGLLSVLVVSPLLTLLVFPSQLDFKHIFLLFIISLASMLPIQTHPGDQVLFSLRQANSVLTSKIFLLVVGFIVLVVTPMFTQYALVVIIFGKVAGSAIQLAFQNNRVRAFTRS